MRTLKRFTVIVAAFFAITVVGVANASAAQFTASATGELVGSATEAQTFTVNGGTIACNAAKSSGFIVSTATEEQHLTVEYSSCKAFGIIPVDISPATFLYTSNGQVHIRNQITFEVTGGILGTCHVTVPVQTVGAITFVTSGNQVTVTPNVSNIRYTTTGGLCGTAGSNGTLVGRSVIGRLGAGSVSFDH